MNRMKRRFGIRLSPLTIKKLKRFHSIKRGYYSFIIFALMVLISFGAELLVNSRALMVRYEGNFYFPTYGDIIPGSTFGLDYDYEADYRQLAEEFRQAAEGNWVIMPPVPYNPYENDFREGSLPPDPPSWANHHFRWHPSPARSAQLPDGSIGPQTPSSQVGSGGGMHSSIGQGRPSPSVFGSHRAKYCCWRRSMVA